MPSSAVLFGPASPAADCTFWAEDAPSSCDSVPLICEAWASHSGLHFSSNTQMLIASVKKSSEGTSEAYKHAVLRNNLILFGAI